MERRSSLVVILLATIFGSAAIAPRSSIPAYTYQLAAASESGAAVANASLTAVRAHTANGIVQEFLSGKIKLTGSLDKDATNADVIDALMEGALILPEWSLILPERAVMGYRGWSVDSLIATVPDPVESGLGSQFDDYVDSIERAVGANGYVLDHFYNPWPSPAQLAKKAKGEDSDGKKGTSDDIQLGDQAVRIYEVRPGLILFRDEINQRLLVVFLVGETPTTGVHKGAFESALKQAAELPMEDSDAACPGGPYCQFQIKVLGPSFSGSVTSMIFGIQEWATAQGDPVPEVKIISGSATAVDPDEFSKNLEQGTYEYQTTIIPNRSTMAALLSWLGRPDGKEVAFLSEENTSFGNFYSSRLPMKRRDPWPKMLFLRFPMHIAELQQAAERAAQVAKTPASNLPSLSNPNLPVDSQGSRSRRDLVPLYSTSEINSAELVLDATLQGIDEHKIGYVIIAATDPADTRSLVHWLRQNCRNVIPIVLNADLMYLHSDFNADSRGIILASTYPLYLEDQLWTLPSDRSRWAIQFPLSTSEGVYNATLALLNGRAPLLDYDGPFASHPTMSKCTDAHPLWISMVGADQIWPISIENTCVSKDYPINYMVPISQTGADVVSDDEFKLYPKAFVIVCFLIVLGCCAAWSLTLINRIGDPNNGFGPIWIRQILSPAVLPEYSDVRHTQVLLLSTVLFGLFVTVAWYFFLPLLTPAWNLASVPSTGLVALLMIAALLVAGLVAPPSWLANPPWGTVAPLALAAAGVMALNVVPGDSTTRLFLFLRTAHLDSKVSPLVPMLLTYAAAIALIFGALRRLALLESRQILTPFLNFGTASFSGFRELEKNVRELVEASRWSRQSYAIAAPIVIAYLVAFPLHQLPLRDIHTPGFETGFELLFFIVSLAVYVGIGLAIVKMVSVWLSVRTLLRRIFTHPSRGGYAAYREQLHILKEPAVDLLSRVPAMSQLEVALDQARQLLIETEDPSTSAVPEVNARLSEKRLQLRILLSWIERGINETEQAQANGEWRDEIEKKRDTERRLGSLSRTIAHIFEPLWRTVGANKAREKADKDSQSIDTIGEIYVASRVVDFLRQVMPQLETLALTTTLAMLLMLFAVSSYPFPARDDLLWFSWVVVLATVGSMMWMFFSLNRDRVASMIAGTTPGQTDWNSTLVLQVATHALLPMLVLLGAAFPARLGTFVTWIGSLFGGHA